MFPDIDTAQQDLNSLESAFNNKLISINQARRSFQTQYKAHESKLIQAENMIINSEEPNVKES